MAGHWVGPCDVDEFFSLTMPLNLKEGEAEVLPHIDKKHFSGKKPRSENAVAHSFVAFFMKNKDKSHFPGLKVADSSNHTSKVKPDVNIHEADDASVDADTHTRLDTAISATEVKKRRKEIFKDAHKDGGPFEAETKGAKDARGQLASYAVEFCARQHRTHFFLVYIYFPLVRFIRFDRCGALVSKPFNISKDCTPLIRFYSRLSQMTDAQRGYDTTVTRASDAETKLAYDRLKEWAPKHQRPVFKMDVYDDATRIYDDKQGACNENTNATNDRDDPMKVDEQEIKEPPKPRKFLVWGSLADPEAPLGRATRGYPALEVTDGLDKAQTAPVMFLKEQWRSKAIERGEIAILRELNERGIKHVPTFVCGGDIPGQVTQTDAYATHVARRGGKDIDRRTHVRFVILEVGRPIERFSSSKEMFQAVYDAFQGHKQAFDVCGILHRDVSGGNILILPKGGGLLNDWDMAVKVEEVERGPRAHERTGTWAFMSIDLLEGERRAHKVSDDLESFFWVVLYYSLLYLPHNKASQLGQIISAIFEQYTYYEEAKGGQGKTVAVREGSYIGGRNSPRLEFNACMPLTKFVASFLHKLNNWRIQACQAIDAANADIICDENLPEPASFEEPKHKDVEHIWEITLRSSWPANDAAKLQLVKKPLGTTGQAPPEGTGGGGSKKRKGIDESDFESDNEEPRPKKVKRIISEAPAGGTKGRTSKKMSSVATRRSTCLRKGSTN
ncbi:hypothetical protein CCMSSC00406_0009235 [Pleurotus cornucopiae]|uniref:Uncharacterized protein n=1 Tax=Pleurotus cornucopiae TaxID=5321 RepID=A0ACB7IZB0_PLECO|nr:hypothetical protein CCMSSC00406_0009235 [Pleurotus cornucopiae]